MRRIADQPFDPKFSFWTRANVGEVLPAAPSPLGWDLLWDAACRPGWRDCMVDRLGIGADEINGRPAPNTEWPPRGADAVAANVVGDVLQACPGAPASSGGSPG